MQHITKAGTSVYGKAKVYFCCHPADLDKYFKEISEDILRTRDCSIWFCDDPRERLSEEHLSELKQMQLFVLPVTARLLGEPTPALDLEFSFARENNIPVLPLMQEAGLVQAFNRKCGEIQFLDKHAPDPTAVSFQAKLSQYLSAVLISDEQVRKIHAAFCAHIFLSYRKTDRRAARELMQRIHRLNYTWAVWYDEFLVPGEDFNQLIEQKLKESDLFVLAVTPRVLEKRVDEFGVLRDNYIVENEYRIAKECAKPILPAEVEATNRSVLEATYPGIPACVDPKDDAAFLESLTALLGSPDGSGAPSPEQRFCLGLAYLNGVNVDVSPALAAELITASAEAGVLEAINQLITMYSFGIAVPRSDERVEYWLRKKVALLETRLSQAYQVSDAVALAKAYQQLGETLSTSSSREQVALAETFYNKALSLWNGLEPENQTEKLDHLGQLYRLLAIWYESFDRLTKAREMYETLLRQRRAAVSRSPEDLLAKRHLALVLCDLGILHYKLAEYETSIAYHQEALALCEPYAADYNDFAIVYGLASNRAATTLETSGNVPLAIRHNRKACEVFRNLCARYNDAFALQLAGALLNKGILVSALGTDRDPLAKSQYLEAIAIYEANSSQDLQHLFCQMVAYYKLANLYLREGNRSAAISAYERSIAIADHLQDAPATEELCSQRAIIYLDYGTILYALHADSGDSSRFLRALQTAAKLYETLCEKGDKYFPLLKETRMKLSAMQNSAAAAAPPEPESSSDALPEILALCKKGDFLKNAEEYGQAMGFYLAALQKLDGLLESGSANEEYGLCYVDLCEKIGKLLQTCDSREEATKFYHMGYTKALQLFHATNSENSILAVIRMSELLGSVAASAAEAKKYYGAAYKACKVLFAWAQTEEYQHRVALSAVKLATADPEAVDTRLLCEARDIWKALFQQTLNEQYFLFFVTVRKMLEP